ncbi:hypothetical protein DL96DRAFT_1819264 [Flagelloscypha sp. PMI_526]|nr:hypothetical protein DL96DRAFT_1819264 [Flagelloscypha sp. PMI_526]
MPSDSLQPPLCLWRSIRRPVSYKPNTIAACDMRLRCLAFQILLIQKYGLCTGLLNGRRELAKLYTTEGGHMLAGPTPSASSQGQGPSVYFLLNMPRTILPSPATSVSLSPILYSLHIPYSGAPDDTELLWPDPPNTIQIYADIAHALHLCYRLFFEKHTPMRVIMIWITVMIPPESLRFLSERRPRALMILAHVLNLYRWCRLREASWWGTDPPRTTALVREMLPNDSWKAYLDRSFAGTSVVKRGDEQIRFESVLE